MTNTVWYFLSAEFEPTLLELFFRNYHFHKFIH